MTYRAPHVDGPACVRRVSEKEYGDAPRTRAQLREIRNEFLPSRVFKTAQRTAARIDRGQKTMESFGKLYCAQLRLNGNVCMAQLAERPVRKMAAREKKAARTRATARPQAHKTYVEHVFVAK